MHGMGCVTSCGNSIEPATKPGLRRGTVVIRVTDVRERVVFGDGLPNVAYREIVAIEIVETKSGQLRWDPKTETWRDAFDIAT